jgi:imidazolonepropionase-like amidohydrolase
MIDTPLKPSLRVMLMAAALAVAPAAARAATTTDYVVLTSGTPSGEMSVKADRGRREVTYRYNDRGRGPDTRSVIVLDAQQRPTSLSIDGVDYMKLKVAERFSRSGGRAIWQAANDKGETRATGVYFPSEFNSEHLAVLARALLKAPGQRLALLPAGEARIERLSRREETLGGVKRTLSLYAIHGLDFSPLPLWLDEAGELVVETGPWFGSARKDAVALVPALLAAQESALDARDAAQAARLIHRPTAPVAFTNVTVFDSEARALRPRQTVLVEAGRIVAVGPSARVPVPAGAQVIDGAGKTLSPGFWDMHAHILRNHEGLLHLSAGVTGIRDVGNTLEDLQRRKQRFDTGELVGPRIVSAGFIDGPGVLAGPIKVLASTPEEVRAHIRNYADHGYVQIKLYSSFDPKLVPVAAQEAHRLGLRLGGHVPAGMTLSQAVAAGYDEVNHLNFVALNFMSPEINAKTNGITRITAIAEHAWELDPGDARTSDFVAYLKSRGTTVDPTLAIFEGQLLGEAGRPSPALAGVSERLPPVVRRAHLGSGLARTPQEAARNAKSFQRMQQLLRRLHDGGVPLVPGTDAVAGFTLQRELELYVQAGIPAADVLYMATLGSARVAQQQGRLGVIAPGMLADMVLIDGDPIARISDVRKVALVMKDGVVFEPRRLLAEVGVAPPAR